MREAGDFADYLVARWPTLVRVVVLLGAPQPMAEEVAAAALARCRRRWRDLQTSGNRDAEVLDVLLAVWADVRVSVRDHGDSWEAPREPLDVEARLDRLSEAERQAVVLHAVADRGPTRDDSLAEDVRRAAAGVHVGPPPAVDALRGHRRSRRSRRRSRGRVAAAAALGAALLLGATYALAEGDGDPTDLDPAPVRSEANGAGVAWWADGTLHLERVAVRLPSVVDLVVVAGGAAVVTDRDQRVVLVEEDGERTVLGTVEGGAVEEGTAAKDTGLAASDDGAWVGWVSDGTEVVLDLSSRLGDVAGEPTTGDAPSYPDLAGTLDGRGGQLSPDGAHVLTTVPDGRSAYGTIRLRDTRTGAVLPTGIGPDDVVLVSRFGRPGTVSHVVARLQDLPRTDDYVRSSFSGRLELRTCWITSGRCHVDATVPAGDALPVLATP